MATQLPHDTDTSAIHEEIVAFLAFNGKEFNVLACLFQNAAFPCKKTDDAFCTLLLTSNEVLVWTAGTSFF